MDYRILYENGFDVDFGLECTGSDDSYLHLIQKYYKISEKTEDELSKNLVEKNIEAYTIAVHALKSTSKMIGAMEFAKVAEEMELLGKAGEYSKLLIKTPDFFDEYEKVLDIIKPYGEMEEVHPKGELSASEASKVANELLESLDDFDDEAAAEWANKLAGFPFRIRQKGMLKEAINHIYDYDYDEATEIIKELLPEIKD